MLQTILFFVLGAAALIVGAELLVRGAARIAIGFGITPLVVGLVIVAFGTSAPEMAVTGGAAYTGNAGLAIGNVVGSNIFNILVVLGASAVVAPLVVSRQIVKLDAPLMIFAALLVGLMALDGMISVWESAILAALIIAYTVLLIWLSRREVSRDAAAAAEVDIPEIPAGEATGNRFLDILAILGGIGLLVLGAEWLVDASVATAAAFGVSELVIGLTIVAAGTSLPEVATSVLASIRGERDIAVGNAVGSCLFNSFAVLGFAGLLSGNGLPVEVGAVTFDIPVMIAVSIALLPVAFNGYKIARWEGLVFVAYYVFYLIYVVLDATHHHRLDEFTTALIWFIIPLTLLTFAVIAIRGIRRRAGMMPQG